jgi:hypothetical protein
VTRPKLRPNPSARLQPKKWAAINMTMMFAELSSECNVSRRLKKIFAILLRNYLTITKETQIPPFWPKGNSEIWCSNLSMRLLSYRTSMNLPLTASLSLGMWRMPKAKSPRSCLTY